MLMMLPKSQRPKRPVWQWLRRRQRLAESAPPASRAGSALVAFLYRDNGLHRADIERIYRVGIRAAKHQIIITNEYFFPGFRLLLELDRQTGVEGKGGSVRVDIG